MKTTLLLTAILLTALSPAAAFAEGGVATESRSSLVQASSVSQPVKVTAQNEWYVQADALEANALTLFASTDLEQSLIADRSEASNVSVSPDRESQRTAYGPTSYSGVPSTTSHAGHDHGANFDGYCAPGQTHRDLKIGSARQFSDIDDGLYVKNDYDKDINFLASDATGPIVGARLKF